MEEKEKNKFFPKNDRCITYSVVPLMLGFLTILLYITSNAPIYILFSGFAIIVLGLILLICFVFGWNKAVYFYDDRVEQTRFGKKYVWYFEDMVEFKYTGGGARLYGCMPSLLIITCQNAKKPLKIESISRCVNKFYEKSQSYPIGKKLNRYKKWGC